MGWGRDCQLNACKKKFVHTEVSRFIGRKVSDDDDDDWLRQWHFRVAVHSYLLFHILFVTVVISMVFLLYVSNILLKIMVLYLLYST